MEINVILVFDNKIYIKKIKNYNKIIIKDLIRTTIDDISYKEFNNNINDYFIIKNGSTVLPSTIAINGVSNGVKNGVSNGVKNDRYRYSKTVYITCYRKMRGGADILDMILKPIEIILFPIFVPIKAIADVFIAVMEFILWMFEFVIWFVQFVVWVFSDLLNPTHFTSEFFNSIMMILIAIFSTFFNMVTALAALIVNNLSSWMQGFWGWDQSSLTKSDKESNYFQRMDLTKGTKYYLTSSNTVPFSVILGTILCPPIGVFMDMGTSGWLNIIVCCLLTLAFYIPGLFYALIIIYS